MRLTTANSLIKLIGLTGNPQRKEKDMIQFFSKACIKDINRAIKAQLAANGVGKVTCKTVADEVGLDPEDGHVAVSMVIRHGGAPGVTTRRKLGICPVGHQTAAEKAAAAKVEPEEATPETPEPETPTPG